MHVDILRQIQEDLKAPMPSRVTFSMRDWQQESASGETTCCAIGLHIKRHPEVELKIRIDEIGNNYPQLHDHSCISAVMAYLNIDRDQAIRLFDSGFELETRDDVWQRIENFIEGHEHHMENATQ